MKKLYKSQKNKIICGLIGGIGEYFDVDPAILRVGFIIITTLTAIIPGIIGYFLACLVAPKKHS